MDASDDICVLCNLPFTEETVKVALRAKGCETISRISKERGDNVKVSIGQYVHTECRRKYNHPSTRYTHQIQSAPDSDETARVLRSCEQSFQFDKNCLFCGNAIAEYEKRKRPHRVFKVRTIRFQEELQSICNERNDDWSVTVKGRLHSANDLPAADAYYHQTCSVNFRTKKQLPTVRTVRYDTVDASHAKISKRGRPFKRESEIAFDKVLQYLEDNDYEQTCIKDLVEKMKEYLSESDTDTFSAVYMKKRIMSHFGDRIVITEINGLANVVTFKTTASNILNDFYTKPQHHDPESEKKRIIDTASKLLKNDIKSIEASKAAYPPSSSMSTVQEGLAYLPGTLREFLQGLFTGKDIELKVASIGQAIIQAVRPRVMICPLQVGLGVEMHHHFGSKFLIESLYRHGFCCSYKEVKKFETSAATGQGTDIPGYIPGHFMQYVADNVDHNTGTLDGKNTFHGMGIIATVTPAIQTSVLVNRIDSTNEDIAAVGKIDLYYCKYDSSAESSIVYPSLPELIAEDRTHNVDILWKAAWLLRPRRAQWNGMMQMLHRGEHPGKSSVFFLPMIDLSPSDQVCVYSTLKFVSAQAKRYDVTPIVTFDQPLWWKAFMLQDKEPEGSDVKRIVLRLGGLHMEMSFLGSIGFLMSGSGIQELLEVVYAENVVPHILNGKAISRAIRAHLLVYSILYGLLLSSIYDLPPLECKQGRTVPVEDDNVVMHMDIDVAEISDYALKTVCQETTFESDSNEDRRTEQGVSDPLEHSYEEVVLQSDNEESLINDLEQATVLYDELVAGKSMIDDIVSSDILNNIQTKLNKAKTELNEKKTAKLWLQYLHMIEILQGFIKAERTGDWKSHLKYVAAMLPFMAASGHNHYTKSGLLYVDAMNKLETTHPDVYQHFMNGLHVVRRRDRYWGGLSTDLIIEQVLMRSVKSTGGMTRGRGMTERQRTVWLLSMPACAEISSSMQDLTGVSYVQTSDLHKEETYTRIERDCKDSESLLEFLNERNPFEINESVLQNICSGVTSKKGVNVESAEIIGMNILDHMCGKKVEDYSFKRKMQAVQMSTNVSVKVEGDRVQIDPQLLFQRLIVIAQGEISAEELGGLFSYELCTHAPALFDSSGQIRVANKPILAEALWECVKSDMTGPPETVQYILDGGALLQRLPWFKGKTYDELCEMYTDYVVSKYGRATVVFDGYEGGPNTKDSAHVRRTGGVRSTTVHFNGNMVMNSNKEQFLSNPKNKQRFIHFLSDKLQESGCATHHSDGDADLLIVKKAIESSRYETTVLIGEDTDLLILLLYYATEESYDIFLKPEQKKNVKRAKVWDIKAAQKRLGLELTHNILVLHALLGCDTTSRVFGIGKGVAVKLFKSNNMFRDYVQMLNKSVDEIDKTDIVAAGEKALVTVYHGKQGECLNDVRVSRFLQKVAESKHVVEPSSLPPTSASTKFHTLRVYHQVQQWKGNTLPPEDWGWELNEQNELQPIKSDKPPAPQKLLNVIRCCCKGECQTMRCTCRRHGLPCSVVCRECRGASCTNSVQMDNEH